jgi:hypothetical protein
MARDGLKSRNLRAERELARLLQISWHHGRTVRPIYFQGVYIMFAKLQNAAFAMTGALLVAGLFIGAAVPVTPIA